jgi:soluble lytic murein transglycosylase-like protein
VSGIDVAVARVNALQQRLGAMTTPPGAGFDRHLGTAAAKIGASSAVATVGPERTAWEVEAASFLAPRLGASDAWTERLPAAAGPHLDDLQRAAADAGIDPRMLAAVAWAESSFVPDAVSHAGAIGLTQLMPGTAHALSVDPHDPAQNLAGGARYLREQYDRFGSVELMLAAYNAGPGAVGRAGGIPDIAETQQYVPRVLDYYRQLGGIT